MRRRIDISGGLLPLKTTCVQTALLGVAGIAMSAFSCDSPYCQFEYLGGRGPIAFDAQVAVDSRPDVRQKGSLTLQHRWFCSLYRLERAFFDNDGITFAECKRNVLALEDELLSRLDVPLHYGFAALLELSLLRMMQSADNKGEYVDAAAVVELLPPRFVDSALAGGEAWGSPRNARRVAVFRELLIIADSIIAHKRVHGIAPLSKEELYAVSEKARSMKVLYASKGTSWRVFLDIDEGFADRARIFVPSVCELGGSVKTFTVQVSDDFSALRERLFHGGSIGGSNPKWACHVNHAHPVVVRGHPMQWGDGVSVESQAWGSGVRVLRERDL